MLELSNDECEFLYPILMGESILEEYLAYDFYGHNAFFMRHKNYLRSIGMIHKAPVKRSHKILRTVLRGSYNTIGRH
jgi:hypothetical protein